MSRLQDMQKGLIAHMQQYANMVDRINANLDIDPDDARSYEDGTNFNKLYHRIDALEKENAELKARIGGSEHE